MRLRPPENATLADRAIAGRRLKADLYGLEVEKAHVSGKLIPFVFAHRAILHFSVEELRVIGC
jgi:hypothetical protein